MLEIYYKDKIIKDGILEADFVDNASCADNLLIKLKKPLGHNILGQEIMIKGDNISSGIMYIDGMEMDYMGQYIYARSIPRIIKKNYAYVNAKFEDIMYELAEEIKLPCFFCTNKDLNMKYRYIIDENISNLGLMNKLAILESMRLKIESGRIYIIGLDYGQSKGIIDIDPKDKGFKQSITEQIKLFYTGCNGDYVRAVDREVNSDVIQYNYEYNAGDIECAMRWAIGLLSCHNMKNDRIILSRESDIKLNLAMDKARLVYNAEDMGEYIIDSIRHDLIKGISQAEMQRLHYGVVIEL